MAPLKILISLAQNIFSLAEDNIPFSNVFNEINLPFYRGIMQIYYEFDNENNTFEYPKTCMLWKWNFLGSDRIT